MERLSTASVVADFLRYRIQITGDAVDDFESDEGIGMDPPYENVPDELHEAVIHLTQELMNNYKDFFDRLPDQLELTEHSIEQTFLAVTNELFSDGVISWGRMIAFFAFGGAMCEWCLEKHYPRPVRVVEERMTTYIETHLKQWIVDNGGWDGLVDLHYERSNGTVSSGSSAMWTGKQLAGVATLGLLTVGALFFKS